MKKIFSVALAAMMTLTVFSFVGCKNKDKEPEIPTPTDLTGTVWVSGAGTSFVATLKFQTATTGVRLVSQTIGDQTYDSESDITYIYADGIGAYEVDRWEEPCAFVVIGGTLTADEEGIEMVYKYQSFK